MKKKKLKKIVIIIINFDYKHVLKSNKSKIPLFELRVLIKSIKKFPWKIKNE